MMAANWRAADRNGQKLAKSTGPSTLLYSTILLWSFIIQFSTFLYYIVYCSLAESASKSTEYCPNIVSDAYNHGRDIWIFGDKDPAVQQARMTTQRPVKLHKLNMYGRKETVSNTKKIA